MIHFADGFAVDAAGLDLQIPSNINYTQTKMPARKSPKQASFN